MKESIGNNSCLTAIPTRRRLWKEDTEQQEQEAQSGMKLIGETRISSKVRNKYDGR